MRGVVTRDLGGWLAGGIVYRHEQLAQRQHEHHGHRDARDRQGQGAWAAKGLPEQMAIGCVRLAGFRPVRCEVTQGLFGDPSAHIGGSGGLTQHIAQRV